VLVPGVGDEPVLGAILNTIAKDADSMATLIATRSVLVDAASVEHKVLIDGEGTLARAVGADLDHHVLLTTDGVDISSLALVVGVVDGRIVDAGGLARRSGKDLTLAGVLGAWDVVVAAGKAVLDALLTDKTSGLPVAVGTSRIATIAGASVRAAVHVLSREDDVLTVLDALTVAHGLSSSKGPAGSTVRLVADHAHGLALGPVGAGVEALGSSSTSRSRVGALRRVLRVVPGTLDIETEESLDLVVAETSSGRLKRGSPELLGRVDGLNVLTSGEGTSCRSTGSKSKEGSDELHLSYYIKNK